MYHSTGIDNLEFKLSVTRDEAAALRTLCMYKERPSYFFFDEEDSLIRRSKREDVLWYVLLNDYEDPKIFLRFAQGKVFANLNVPKLTFGHNVRLAGPKEISLAIRTLEQNTSKAAPRLNWLLAEVSRLDINHTREVPIFTEYFALLHTQRCSWRYDHEVFTGAYLNSNTGNWQICVYDKAIHLRDNGKEIPRDVLKGMDSPENDLFRFEPRLNQSPCSQLRKYGGWNMYYLLAEDLVNGPGFIAALKYLQWQFERHVPVPVLRLPALVKNPSVRAYAAHNSRATANENPQRLKERAIADHKAGMISAEVLRAELSRADLFERRVRAQNLHEILNQDCEKQIAKILVTMKDRTNVAGQVQTQQLETEHATRESRHVESIPGHSLRV